MNFKEQNERLAKTIAELANDIQKLELDCLDMEATMATPADEQARWEALDAIKPARPVDMMPFGSVKPSPKNPAEQIRQFEESYRKTINRNRNIK